MLKDISGIIDDLAEKAMRNEYREFLIFCNKNLFASNLLFKIGHEEKSLCSINALFSADGISNFTVTYTNIEAVLVLVKEKFIERETKKLFEKLETIKEYLQEEN